RRMNVKLVCTTDDPVDSLEYHLKLKEDARLGFEIPVLPAFRPDNAMDTGDPKKISNYIKKLEEVSNISISSFNDYLNALKSRHDFFGLTGCSVSDHGLEEIYADDFSDSEIDNIFAKVHRGNILYEDEH